MKEILVISGKGGTGKTVITGALAALAQNKVMVDCDVDAANLHILMQPDIKEQHDFKCGMTAYIDQETCAQCGLCRTLCRFDAIKKNFNVSETACEGCGFCAAACPVGAIEMKEDVSGAWFVSDTRFGPFVHARLGIAKENSGKLVSLIKKQAKGLAEQQGLEWIIVDGAPGIGCPVIASLSGVHTALVVTEPTLSGLHDAKRVIKVARHFGVPVKLLINKYDLNKDMSGEIEKFCREEEIEMVGKLPFQKEIVAATLNKQSIMESLNGEIKEALLRVKERVLV